MIPLKIAILYSKNKLPLWQYCVIKELKDRINIEIELIKYEDFENNILVNKIIKKLTNLKFFIKQNFTEKKDIRKLNCFITEDYIKINRNDIIINFSDFKLTHNFLPKYGTWEVNFVDYQDTNYKNKKFSLNNNSTEIILTSKVLNGYKIIDSRYFDKLIYSKCLNNKEFLFNGSEMIIKSIDRISKNEFSDFIKADVIKRL
jgi:hypothetical protein